VSDAPVAESNAAMLSVVAGPMVTPILGRVIGVYAARAELPLDRLSDAVLLGDAVAASGGLHADGNRVQVGIESSPRRIDLRVGPLVPGGGERLLRAVGVPGIGDIISRLASEVRIESEGDEADFVHLSLVTE
jgi:serine/threonine-protein kinase RsbW